MHKLEIPEFILKHEKYQINCKTFDIDKKTS